MDTIVGCFAVGLEPSGSADPFGLRRAAIGIWTILLERGSGWDTVWYSTWIAAIGALADHGVSLDKREVVEEFFRARLRGILVDQGIPPQDVDAALANGCRYPCDARARALACGKISKEARAVFKRVANILDDARAKNIVLRQQVDPGLFVSTVEHELFEAITQARSRESGTVRNYGVVFDSLVQLQPAVAAFFDKGGVMVMDPNSELRDNRLALLNWLIKPYMQIADFRLLTASAGGAS